METSTSSRSAAGALADAASKAAESAWRLAFLLSRSRHARVSPLVPRGGDRVLVVAPHPDDEAAGCAGALLLHAAAGDVVTLAVATDGRRSRAHGLAEDEMARRRRAEGAEAAEVQRIARVEWLGFPEGAADEKHDAALRDALAPLLSGATILYAPSIVDYHPEHVRVARVLAAVLAETASSSVVRVYQSQVPLGSALVNCVADVSAHEAAIRRALACYETQTASLQRCLRLRAYAAARHGCASCAEEFWEMPGAVYARLMCGGADATRFRGVRRRAFRDPVAYVSGRRARGRLAARAGR